MGNLAKVSERSSGLKLLCGTLLALAIAPSSLHAHDAATPSDTAGPPCCYMPKGTYSTDTEIDERERRFVTSVLILMQEDNIAENRSDERIVRCLFIPSFGRPAMVRTTLTSVSAVTMFKQLSGNGGFELGQLALAKSGTLSAKESSQLEKLLAPLPLDGLGRTGGGPAEYLDHDLLVLEVLADARYHVRFEELPNDHGNGADLRRFCAKAMMMTAKLSTKSTVIKKLLDGVALQE